MEFHVAFLPEEAGDVRGRAVAVIDVIRATTSLLLMVEHGCDEILVAPSVEAARAYRDARAGVLLAGEQGGLAPEGFDFGNSPAAFARADLTGRRIVFATTNGTRALCAAGGASLVFAACLRNRAAVAQALAAEAVRRAVPITVVCAGREGRFGLDDAYTAGAIADAVLAQPGTADLAPTDAARAACALFRAHADAGALFRTTAAGRHVARIGLAEDLPVCAALDRSAVTPRLGERIRLLGANGSNR